MVRGRAQEGGVVVKLGSLFDGIGGFPLAAVRNGIEPVWASEIEQVPIEITKKHFPNMVHLGDITQINGAEIEPVDIITAGSPCQDLSVAGKRAGLEGERSGLFMEFVRIVREMREATNGAYPKFIIWENVPGAFSSNRGQDFRAVLEEIMEAEIPMPYSGKWATSGMVRGNGRSLAWRVLDAQYWGVPQRRKRIFLVADFTGGSAAEILFEQEGVRGDFAESREAWQEVATTTEGGVGKTSYGVVSKGNGDAFMTPERHMSLTSGGGQAGQGYPCVLSSQELVAPFDTTQITSPQNRSRCEFGLPCHTPNAHAHAPAIVYGLDQQGGKGQASYTENVSPTILSDSHGTPHAVAYQPGNLTRQAGAEPSRKVFPTLGASTQGDQFPHVAQLYDKTHAENDLVCQTKVVLNDQGGQSVNIDYDLAPTLRAEAHGNHPAVLQPQVPFTQTAFGQYAEGVGTLRASGGDRGGGSETLIADRYAVRRLTPTECERLMGFPDNWTAGYSDTARYKALGNSVAVPCVEWIMRQIAGRGNECE